MIAFSQAMIFKYFSEPFSFLALIPSAIDGAIIGRILTPTAVVMISASLISSISSGFVEFTALSYH